MTITTRNLSYIYFTKVQVCTIRNTKIYKDSKFSKVHITGYIRKIGNTTEVLWIDSRWCLSKFIGWEPRFGWVNHV